jgi:hypothetical protein
VNSVEACELAFQMSLTVGEVVLSLRCAIRRFFKRLDSGALTRKHFWLAAGDLVELDACSLVMRTSYQ